MSEKSLNLHTGMKMKSWFYINMVCMYNGTNCISFPRVKAAQIYGSLTVNVFLVAFLVRLEVLLYFAT
jgi:hypothetical protein